MGCWRTTITIEHEANSAKQYGVITMLNKFLSRLNVIFLKKKNVSSTQHESDINYRFYCQQKFIQTNIVDFNYNFGANE